MTYISEVTADAPVNWLRLEETSSTMTDSGSAGGTATVGASGVTRGVAGGIGGSLAVTFNGGTSANISRTKTAAFLTSAFTVECWIKTSTSGAKIIAGYNIGSRGFELGKNASNKAYFMTTNSNGSFTVTSTGATLTDNVWHHLVGVSNGTTIRIYVDGVANSNTGAQTGTYGITGTLDIGAGSSGAGFVGSADELALYTGELSSTRIGVHYSNNVSSLNVNFPSGTAQAISVAAPNAVATGIKNVQFSAAALTASIDTPNATTAVGTGNVWSAPALTASIDIVEPDIHPQWQTWIRTLTETFGQVDSNTPGTNEQVAIRGSTTRTTFIKFDTSVIPADSVIVSADLAVTARVSSGTANYLLKPVTSDFDPATVTYGTAPTVGSTFATSAAIGTSDVVENFDITDRLNAILAGTEYGIALSGNTINTIVASMDLEVTYMATGDSTTVLEVATISIAAPDATVIIDSATVVEADPVTLSVEAFTPTVSTTGEAILTPSPALIDVEAVNPFFGSPSVTIEPAPIELIIYTPNAEAIGGTDVTVVADTANLTLEVNDVTLNFDTDVTVQASAALISVKMIGFWNAEEDRYYQAIQAGLQAPITVAGETLKATDQWFRLEESSGTEAADSWILNAFNDDDPAVYYGEPTLRLEAPDLRHAVGLDGVDDWIDLPENIAYTGGWSNEFVFRTSATSGVIWSNANGSVSLEVVAGKLQLVDYGTSFTNNPNPVRYNMTGTVNDGQWHHVVVSAPNPDTSSTRAFIMLDGTRVFGRISNQVFRRSALPSQVGVRNPSVHDTSRLGFLAADFMEFTVRGTRWISEDEAFANYLEFTGAFIYRAPVLGSVSVEAPGAFGRGNQKKMLLLWGFPSGTTLRPDKLNLYQSVWSGVQMPAGSPNLIYPDVPARMGTFDWNGYKVYPVHMWDRTLSVEGTVEQQSDWDNETGTYEAQHLFLDNESGESRLIDLSEDLLVDVREFDVIHVLNWPDPNITTGLTGTGVWATNIPLTEANYDAQIEQMRNGIMAANSDGVGLWIAEPKQAVEFGIITGWDAHGGYDASGQFDPGEHAEFRDVEIGPQQPDSAYDGRRPNDGLASGYYDTTYGVRKRRIVATATDFSEFETWYRDEYIGFHKDYRQAPYSDVYAHNLVHLEDGLTIGSEIDMDVWWLDYRTPEYGGPIVSAKPDGIVGTVIAKEQEQYRKDGNLVANPYANNATTILVERGEVVQGSPVGGRIFVELMDNSQSGNTNMQHKGAFLNYLGGAPVQPNQKPSGWDFDSRRNREVYSEISFQVIETLTTPNGKAQRNIASELMYQTFTINDIPNSMEIVPYVGMNDRGLNWLSIRPWEDDDTTRVFATAAQISVTAPGGTADVVKNNVFEATPVLARVDVPTVYDGPDVTIQAGFPAEITVQGGAYVKAVLAEPAEITVETPNATATTVGEDIVFYFDYPEYTFYLKEEA